MARKAPDVVVIPVIPHPNMAPYDVVWRTSDDGKWWQRGWRNGWRDGYEAGYRAARSGATDEAAGFDLDDEIADEWERANRRVWVGMGEVTPDGD